MSTGARLEDALHSRRIGLKGPRAAAWLREHDVTVPGLPNSWRALGDEAQPRDLIARLGNAEFFVEQASPAALIERLARELSVPIEGVYPVLREDRALVLSGVAADDVLAQVCNVDFKAVSRDERHVVMTMMIGVAVLVIPQNEPVGSAAPQANAGCYRVWCDPSYGDYLWSSLQDAMRSA